jgi:hypothetical protein
MSVRSWAVSVVSTAAVLAGLVVVQSGIAGTAALPVLPHRAGGAPSASSGDAELPAPAEQGAPPPAAGAVRDGTPAGRTVVVVSGDRRPAPAAHPPAKRPEPHVRSDKPAKDSPDQPAKAPTKDPKDPKDAERSGKHPGDKPAKAS